MVIHCLRLAFGAALLTLALAGVVSGHSELKSATPGPDAVVVDVPSQLVATFSQDLDAGRSSIELRDGSGKSVARGGRDAANVRTMRITLPALVPATYTVRWTTFSTEDSELARGSYTFTVAAPPPTATPARPTVASSNIPSSPSPTGTATLPPSPRASASPSSAIPATSTPTQTAEPGAPTPSSVRTASSGPEPPNGTGAGDVIIPILAAAVIVAIAGGWIYRNRAR